MDFPLTRMGLQIKYLVASLSLFVVFLAFRATGQSAFFLCLVLWLIISFSFSGKEISADYTKIRDYYSVLGYRVGTWGLMPVVVGVTVKYFSALESGLPATISWGSWKNPSRRLEELVIMLSVQDSRQGTIIGRASVADLDQVLVSAQRLATTLKVPVHMYLPLHYQPADSFK